MIWLVPKPKSRLHKNRVYFQLSFEEINDTYNKDKLNLVKKYKSKNAFILESFIKKLHIYIIITANYLFIIFFTKSLPIIEKSSITACLLKESLPSINSIAFIWLTLKSVV